MTNINGRLRKPKYLVQAKMRTTDKRFYSKAEDRFIIKQRNQEDGISTKQIAEELSDRFGTERTSASVHHRILNVLRFLKTLEEYDYIEHCFLIPKRELAGRKERILS